jgi:hypothetical protein
VVVGWGGSLTCCYDLDPVGRVESHESTGDTGDTWDTGD